MLDEYFLKHACIINKTHILHTAVWFKTIESLYYSGITNMSLSKSDLFHIVFLWGRILLQSIRPTNAEAWLSNSQLSLNYSYIWNVYIRLSSELLIDYESDLDILISVIPELFAFRPK